MCKIVNCGYTQTQHKIRSRPTTTERGVRAMKLEFNACIMLLFFVRSLHIFGWRKPQTEHPTARPLIHSFIRLPTLSHSVATATQYFSTDSRTERTRKTGPVRQPASSIISSEKLQLCHRKAIFIKLEIFLSFVDASTLCEKFSASFQCFAI